MFETAIVAISIIGFLLIIKGFANLSKIREYEKNIFEVEMQKDIVLGYNRFQIKLMNEQNARIGNEIKSNNIVNDVVNI